MNVKSKLAFASIVSVKLLILLYIGLTAEMSLFAQLVLVPLLMLETMAIYGYLYECGLTNQKRRTAKIAGRIEQRPAPLEMKPAA